MAQIYQYSGAQFKSGRFDLMKDGEHVLTGSEQDCWAYIHANHAYSVEHALKYEGYFMREVAK